MCSIEQKWPARIVQSKIWRYIKIEYICIFVLTIASCVVKNIIHCALIHLYSLLALVLVQSTHAHQCTYMCSYCWRELSTWEEKHIFRRCSQQEAFTVLWQVFSIPTLMNGQATVCIPTDQNSSNSCSLSLSEARHAIIH